MLAASQERPAHLGLSEPGRAMFFPSAAPHGQAAGVPGSLAGDTGGGPWAFLELRSGRAVLQCRVHFLDTRVGCHASTMRAQ
jgi:hypothetical protein